MKIPGLPEGVECVRIGPATPEEFQLQEWDGELRIFRGEDFASRLSQIVVQPSEGYVFQFARDSFDERTSEHAQGRWIASKIIDGRFQRIQTFMTFEPKTELDFSVMKRMLDSLHELPFFVDEDAKEDQP
jgi:hypothetical protein